jgi:hypothetical protein
MRPSSIASGRSCYERIARAKYLDKLEPHGLPDLSEHAWHTSTVRKVAPT